MIERKRHKKSFDMESIRSEITRLYLDEGLSVHRLCQKFNLGRDRLVSSLQMWNLPKKSRSDSIKSSYDLRRTFKLCKGCGIQIHGTYNQRSCENCLKQLRNEKYRHTKYGLDPDRFKELMTTQNSACALCKKNFDQIKEKYSSVHVDHDHKTGEVRGLLCGCCNRLLGSIEKKSIEWLRNAIRYAKVEL